MNEIEQNEMKTIRWTVDYPALYWELLDNNMDRLGVAMQGLVYVLMGMENMYRIAKSQKNADILDELKFVGMDEGYFKVKRKRYKE